MKTQRVFSTGILGLKPAIETWAKNWEWQERHGQISIIDVGPTFQVFCEKGHRTLARRLEGAENYWIYLFHRPPAEIPATIEAAQK